MDNIFNYDNQFSSSDNDHNLWEDRFYIGDLPLNYDYYDKEY